MIVVLFCLSTLTFKTEAEEIKDKEFQTFFSEIQERLKDNKGSYGIFINYIDFGTFNKKCKSDFFGAFLWFVGKVEADYEIISKLSSKNNYFLNGEEGCEGWQIKTNSKKNLKQYKLEWWRTCDNDELEGCGCTFQKIKYKEWGENKEGWRIVDFFYL